MLGPMQSQPLPVSSIIIHAARHHAPSEVVSRSVEGAMHRTTYAGVQRRARQLARWCCWRMRMRWRAALAPGQERLCYGRLLAARDGDFAGLKLDEGLVSGPRQEARRSKRRAG